MDTSANTITTMGIISNEVYNTTPGKDYFSDLPDSLVANGTTYTVKDYADTPSGMQALLLESGGKYVIAFRGTAGLIDVLKDAVIGLDNINEQYADAVAFVNKALALPEISESNLILTGHSLGGILTQQVGATLGLDGYAYNPYGVDRLLSTMPDSPLNPILDLALYNIMKSSGLGASEASWAKEHIINVSYNDFGFIQGDILSNIVTELTSEHLGMYLPIYGTDTFWGHSMTDLNVAIAHYNEVLSHFTDKNYNLLTAAYVSVGDYEKTEKIFTDLNIKNTQKDSLSFEFLTDKLPSQLTSKDPANLYALLNLNPFAIEGNLSAYANINPDDYSDMYMQDRATYLYYILDKDARYGGGTGKDSYKAWDTNRVTLQGTSGDQVIFGTNNLNNSYQLNGGAGNDRIYGLGGDDTFAGGGGNDYLEGGAGSDVLYGGGGDDVLMGNDGYGNADTEADILDGGAGYDTYVVGNNDIIYDSDGSGIIIFEGKVLKGVDVTMDSTIYPSNQDHTTYYSKEDEGTYTRNGNSGFTFLSDNGHLLTVYTPLDYTEKIIPKPGGGTMREKTYRGVGVTLENFSSPLVLDLNNDGITSLDLYASPAYFDMEGDGIREKTGWIQTTDALLVFDKNRDGIINDGSELFGNYTTLSNGMKADNGFEALAKYDNNHDGVIDKNDSAYNALSAWIDSNQDGITDDGELHSLNELGVTSISLNATTQTNNYEAQNTITHTSTFTQQSTDAEGNTITEIKTVNDVWFNSIIRRKVA